MQTNKTLGGPTSRLASMGSLKLILITMRHPVYGRDASARRTMYEKSPRIDE